LKEHIMPNGKRIMVAVVALAALGLTGCGGQWPESEMESELESKFDADYPEDAPHEVDCPGDLDVEEGETISCEFTDSHGAGSFAVEVVSVDGSDFEYEAIVDDYQETAAGSD
jgi:hypothetical protein